MFSGPWRKQEWLGPESGHRCFQVLLFSDLLFHLLLAHEIDPSPCRCQHKQDSLCTSCSIFFYCGAKYLFLFGCILPGTTSFWGNFQLANGLMLMKWLWQPRQGPFGAWATDEITCRCYGNWRSFVLVHALLIMEFLGDGWILKHFVAEFLMM